MSTILQNEVAPLWVWILIIAIGSILIILLLTYTIQRCVRQRKKRAGLDIEANGVPTRRLTLRDGKVVASHGTAPSAGSMTLLLSNQAESINSQDREDQISNSWWSKEKASMGSPSTIESPETTPSTVRYSKAPRLSLGSLDGKEPLSNFSSVSDLSVISKPSTAAVNEPRKAKAVNFSRPQARSPPQPSVVKKSRLSVINESTPRNSFIGRIVSWASNNHDNESRKSESHSTETAPRVSLDFAESKEDPTTASSPILNALQELQRLAAAPTPELPSKHPSRTTSTSEDMTLPVGSRCSSVTEMRYKHGHKRSDSGTNFSRKGPYSTHSRSSSVTNFSRPQQVVSNHSRESSNTSMFEEPQATLSGPFDALAGMACRESGASTWSNDSDRAGTLRSEPQRAPTNVTSPDTDTSTINTDLLLSGRTSVTLSTASYTDIRQGHRSRSRSRSRSRGPVRAVNKNGQTVLRKRSLQPPEITMLGPVDPAALENLSVTDTRR